MFLRLPLAFTEHFDATAVDQKMQACCRCLRFDRYGGMFLTPANGAEIRHLPVQTGQLEQALRHSHCLTQRQIKQALDRQAELNGLIAVLLRASPLATKFAVPAHLRVQPDEQRATCFERLVVRLPVRCAVFLSSRFHAPSLPEPQTPRRTGWFMQQSLGKQYHSRCCSSKIPEMHEQAFDRTSAISVVSYIHIALLLLVIKLRAY